VNRPAQTNPDVRASLEAQLHSERERIYAEIHAYPPPIPACDAQFNYLIEKRALVTQELSKVRAIDSQPAHPTQVAAALRQLVTASQILSKSAKTHLLEALT
jgi:hypothetical protein